MPPQPVTIGRGKAARVDAMGGVFTPIPGRALLPAYSYAKQPNGTKAVVFQCPVSVIPDEVLMLLHLWHSCRLLKTLPEAGGLVDQALSVQMSFPMLESFAQGAEGGKSNPETAAALAVTMAFKALGFGAK